MDETGSNFALPGEPEDSIEFQLIKAYIHKRRPSHKIGALASGMCDAPARVLHKKKRTGMIDRASEAGAVLVVTEKLAAIVDSVPLDPEDIETDSDDVIQTIVQLLRESGDRLNEEMKENKSLAKLIRSSFTYSLFEKVTNSFLQKVDPDDIPISKDPEQAKVALTFEVTSRLTALDCHPMNVVMGFGAKYLQQNCTGWVKQHGGWGKAFDTEDDEEVQ